MSYRFSNTGMANEKMGLVPEVLFESMIGESLG